MNPVIPMPSRRIAPGVYEVVGTSTVCRVVQHCPGDVWQLTSNGQPVRSFDRKVDALRYCQRHHSTIVADSEETS